MNAGKLGLPLTIGLGALLVVGALMALGTPTAGPSVAHADPADTEEGTVTDTLMAFYTSAGGPYWIQDDGWGTDAPYCTWNGLGCASGEVLVLELNDNQLTGTIAPELGNLASLETLELSGNSLSGAIPSELGNAGSLMEVVLSYNALTGTIPPELGNLANLDHLILSNNNLTGGIRRELGDLSNLWILDLSANDLSGPIPAALTKMAAMHDLYLDPNPNLICWETEAARDWADGLQTYSGPLAVCPSVHLPLALRGYRTWDAYLEENDSFEEAYGPLEPGVVYQAYPDDESDFYFFELDQTEDVVVMVWDYAPYTTNGSMQLYASDETLIEHFGTPLLDAMTIGPRPLDAGRYYVRVWTSGNHSDTDLYNLQINFQ